MDFANRKKAENRMLGFMMAIFLLGGILIGSVIKSIADDNNYCKRLRSDFDDAKAFMESDEVIGHYHYVLVKSCGDFKI